ncbi:hypothetical protein C4580_05780 [Candidatus Woesearchaeota archaeon]|nr:MAG: hypothetical protein C4580_05780 [Candidatus Woesearchaeota archaeon]
MPHQCVRCNTFYEDGSREILTGCTCGARLFFFIKKEKLAAAKESPLVNLKPEQKKQIEEDVRELAGSQLNDAPVVLDFETIRVTKPGQYELDIVKLFQQDQPVLFKLEDGKYVIDIGASFAKLRKKK